jgi:hypothetical protein
VLANKSTEETAKAGTDVKLHKGETSQNSRRGEAFVLVEKADFDYHIYGTGADRQVVRASKRDDDE